MLNVFFYKDYGKSNNALLEKIYRQNLEVLEQINKKSHKNFGMNELNHSVISEKSSNSSFNYQKVADKFSDSQKINDSFNCIKKSSSPYVHSSFSERLVDECSPRYNLRSRHGTPDSVISMTERLKKPMKNGILNNTRNGNINKVTSP